jgi:hypothetical protein
MILENIQPVCRVPNCKEGAQILSKQGDNIKYMITCRRHHAELIPNDKYLSGGHNHETAKAIG